MTSNNSVYNEIAKIIFLLSLSTGTNTVLGYIHSAYIPYSHIITIWPT